MNLGLKFSLISISVISILLSTSNSNAGEVSGATQSTAKSSPSGGSPSTTTPTSTSSKAAPTLSSSPTTNKSSNILDFDADVIEGERTGPSILIQMDLQAPNLDTLVFQRKNFNDFHSIDMKRKPNYRGK